MKLVQIPFKEVDLHPDFYNSNFHTSVEAPNLPIPTEKPQSFIRWLPLTASSQSIPWSSIQIITLTPAQSELILSASLASLHTREPNRLYTEELASLALSAHFNSLDFPPEGLFLRLDECSAKDGVGGTTALRSVEEVILRLSTSHRATNAMVRWRDQYRESNAQEDAGEADGSAVSVGMELVFLPCDERMDTRREFRVFCAPRQGRITGVSQYRWHQPSFLSGENTEVVQKVTSEIMGEVVRIHEEILTEAWKEEAEAMDRLLLEQGFSFDVLFVEEPVGSERVRANKKGKCVMMELNSFGARSGCGSCLFHWLRDLDVLYGGKTEHGSEGIEKVEFRIST
ncbi:hypothetical protein WAI453_008297 [Rhynchosporium graminicola]|uniref:Uncharacterized protein n=1 Tax=Rhynchosporium graminicola TaxID=2792576 RepID=A0A1E1KMI2_9HELO|nr:uncharacterized protein RCO7_00519 [Rhynchosporium commune]